MSKKYKVVVRETTYLEAEIEAKDFDEAWDKATLMDGGSFQENPDQCSWDVFYITDIKENKTEWYRQEEGRI